MKYGKTFRVIIFTLILNMLGFSTQILLPTNYAHAAGITQTPVPIYRFWSDTYRGHFYTSSEAEKNQVVTNYPDSMWKYEGGSFTAFASPEGNLKPVYRFWSNNYKHHFFTISESEKNSVIANDPNWIYEGIAYYAFADSQPSSKPLHRFWSDNYKGHFYTSSDAEKNSIIANDPNWRYESTAYNISTAAAPTIQSFSGSGNLVTSSFVLQSGLSVFRLKNTGDSVFFVDLYKVGVPDPTDYLATELGAVSVSTSVGISVSGSYMIEVTSSGNWSIYIEHPTSSSGNISSFNGFQNQVTQLVTLSAGSHSLTYNCSADSGVFFVNLVDINGNEVDYPVTELAPTSGSTLVNVPSTGIYLLEVEADGYWSLNLS